MILVLHAGCNGSNNTQSEVFTPIMGRKTRRTHRQRGENQAVQNHFVFNAMFNKYRKIWVCTRTRAWNYTKPIQCLRFYHAVWPQVKAKIEIRSHKRYAATRDCSFLINILPFVRGNKNSRPGENETVKDVCGECGLLGENPLIIV